MATEGGRFFAQNPIAGLDKIITHTAEGKSCWQSPKGLTVSPVASREAEPGHAEKEL
jgi:hypothetical protein